MDRILLVALLTALIHLIDTLFYGVRLSGVKTRHLATAYSLYQIISLLAMVANMIQAPLLSSVVEQGINAGYIAYQSHLNELQRDIRLIILAASGGTAAAALLTPLFVILFNRTIFLFNRIGSLPALILALLSPVRLHKILREFQSALRYLRLSCRHQSKKGHPFSFTRINSHGNFQLRLFCTNVVVIGIWTTGVLSALFAGALLPSFRSTATLLSSIVNGIAVVLAAFLIDPVTAMITDQAIQGIRSENEIMHLTFLLIFSRLLGTFFAQLIFLPAACLVKYVTLMLAQISLLY